MSAINYLAAVVNRGHAQLSAARLDAKATRAQALLPGLDSYAAYIRPMAWTGAARAVQVGRPLTTLTDVVFGTGRMPAARGDVRFTDFGVAGVAAYGAGVALIIGTAVVAGVLTLWRTSAVLLPHELMVVAGLATYYGFRGATFVADTLVPIVAIALRGVGLSCKASVAAGGAFLGATFATFCWLRGRELNAACASSPAPGAPVRAAGARAACFETETLGTTDYALLAEVPDERFLWIPPNLPEQPDEIRGHGFDAEEMWQWLKRGHRTNPHTGQRLTLAQELAVVTHPYIRGRLETGVAYAWFPFESILPLWHNVALILRLQTPEAAAAALLRNGGVAEAQRAVGSGDAAEPAFDRPIDLLERFA